MRDYAKIRPCFWTGSTGKELRGDPIAQIIAFYLMTSPHSEMTGVYFCPIAYISYETGLTPEGASKGLQRCIEAGFCTYDFDREMVWVHEMAKYQIASQLKPNDNRVIGVKKLYDILPESLIKQAFYDKYKAAFLLDRSSTDAESPEAPSKPLATPLQAPSKQGEGSGSGEGSGEGAVSGAVRGRGELQR